MPVDAGTVIMWTVIIAAVVLLLCLWLWPALTLAVLVCLGISGTVLYFVGFAQDKSNADAAYLSLCRKQAVTPQDFAECK